MLDNQLQNQLRALQAQNIHEVDVRDILRATVLSGNDTFLQLLMMQEAFVEHLATADNLILRLAVQENRDEMVQMLLQNERVAQTAHAQNNQALRLACRNGNRVIFEALIQQENVMHNITYNHNEPLRIADQFHNDDIVARLLGMQAVQDMLEIMPANTTYTNDSVEPNDIFRPPRNERRGIRVEVDRADEIPGDRRLNYLANHDENAMLGLGPNEKQALEQMQKRYQDEFNRKGLNKIFKEIRKYLEEKYQERPVEHNGKKYDLHGRPLNKQANHWKGAALKRAAFYTALFFVGVTLGSFLGLAAPTTFLLTTSATLMTALCDNILIKLISGNAVNLSKEVRKKYYQHKVHSAWRFLFQHPNPWISPSARYTQRHINGLSAEISYDDKVRIAYTWLAARDENRELPEGFTKHKQLIKHFIGTMHDLNRAHNYDKTRLNERGKKEEYDDLEGDKPSCPAGLTKRIVQNITLFLNDNSDSRVFTQQLLLARFKEQIIACNEDKDSVFDKLKKAEHVQRDEFYEALESLVVINCGDWSDLEEQERQTLRHYLPSNEQHDKFLEGCKVYWGAERIERQQDIRYQEKRFNSYQELIAHLSQHCLEDYYNSIVGFMKAPEQTPSVFDTEPQVIFTDRNSGMSPEHSHSPLQPEVDNIEKNNQAMNPQP